MQNVTVIPFEDSVKNNKDANLFNKVWAAAKNDDVRENFMFWSDDQVLTDYLDLTEAPIVFNPRGLKYFQEGPEKSKWQERMKHTLEYIQEKTHIVLPYNYDSHVPSPYKKREVNRIFPLLDYNTLPGLCINTAYYGMQEVKAIDQRMVKHTLEGQQKPLGIPSKLLTYLGYDDGTWAAGLAMFLLGFFY